MFAEVVLVSKVLVNKTPLNITLDEIVGGRVAKLVVCQTQDFMTSVTRACIPSGAQETFGDFTESKMLC